jgi:hypothetical protein
MWIFTGVAVGFTIVSVLVWRQRAEVGLKEAYELVQAGLPNETELVQAAARRFERRQAGAVIGAWLGGISALIVFASQGSPIIGVLWSGLIGTFGVAVATCVFHFRAVRAARRDGPRLARLGQRRLRDYLIWPEIVAQYGELVLPLVTAGVGALVLTGQDEPRIGWALVGAGVACLLICGIAHVLQRKVLALSQAASGESELRWAEALRAATLRDLSEMMMWACWLLGGATIIAVDLPSGLPTFVEPLSYVLFCGGIVVLVGARLSGAGKWGLRRSQRAIG